MGQPAGLKRLIFILRATRQRGQAVLSDLRSCNDSGRLGRVLELAWRLEDGCEDGICHDVTPPIRIPLKGLERVVPT